MSMFMQLFLPFLWLHVPNEYIILISINQPHFKTQLRSESLICSSNFCHLVLFDWQYRTQASLRSQLFNNLRKKNIIPTVPFSIKNCRTISGWLGFSSYNQLVIHPNTYYWVTSGYFQRIPNLVIKQEQLNFLNTLACSAHHQLYSLTIWGSSSELNSHYIINVIRLHS